MDKANQLIVDVRALKKPRIIIETTIGKRYESDLSEFKKVYCFPNSQKDWEDVSVSTGGYALTWGCRFEVHVDQVIDLAYKNEKIKQEA